jgi:hypothetical protein
MPMSLRLISGSPVPPPALAGAIEAASRAGWRLEDLGPTWAHLVRRQPVPHGALARLTGRTRGLGCLVRVAATLAGPPLRRLVLGLDRDGRVVATHLDADGRPLPQPLPGEGPDTRRIGSVPGMPRGGR